MNFPKFVIRIIEPLVWKHLHWVFGKMNKVTVPTQTAADILRRSGFKKPIHVISKGMLLSRVTFQKQIYLASTKRLIAL